MDETTLQPENFNAKKKSHIPEYLIDLGSDDDCLVGRDYLKGLGIRRAKKRPRQNSGGEASTNDHIHSSYVAIHPSPKFTENNTDGDPLETLRIRHTKERNQGSSDEVDIISGFLSLNNSVPFLSKHSEISPSDEKGVGVLASCGSAFVASSVVFVGIFTIILQSSIRRPANSSPVESSANVNATKKKRKRAKKKKKAPGGDYLGDVEKPGSDGAYASVVMGGGSPVVLDGSAPCVRGEEARGKYLSPVIELSESNSKLELKSSVPCRAEEGLSRSCSGTSPLELAQFGGDGASRPCILESTTLNGEPSEISTPKYRNEETKGQYSSPATDICPSNLYHKFASSGHGEVVQDDLPDASLETPSQQLVPIGEKCLTPAHVLGSNVLAPITPNVRVGKIASKYEAHGLERQKSLELAANFEMNAFFIDHTLRFLAMAFLRQESREETRYAEEREVTDKHHRERTNTLSVERLRQYRESFGFELLNSSHLTRCIYVAWASRVVPFIVDVMPLLSHPSHVLDALLAEACSQCSVVPDDGKGWLLPSSYFFGRWTYQVTDFLQPWSCKGTCILKLLCYAMCLGLSHKFFSRHFCYAVIATVILPVQELICIAFGLVGANLMLTGWMWHCRERIDPKRIGDSNRPQEEQKELEQKLMFYASVSRWFEAVALLLSFAVGSYFGVVS